MNIEISNIETDKGIVYVYYSVDGVDAEKAFKMTLKEYCELAVGVINEGENHYSLNVPNMEVAVFIGFEPRNFSFREFYNSLSKEEMKEVESHLVQEIQFELDSIEK